MAQTITQETECLNFKRAKGNQYYQVCANRSDDGKCRVERRQNDRKSKRGEKMAITEEFLKDIHPCDEGYQWWLNHGRPADSQATLETLIADEQEDWANWLIVRLMNHKQKIAYAIYAAEQVISIYKLKYSKDDRPQKAIDAAKKCLSDTSTKNKDAAYAAAAAAAANAAANAAKKEMLIKIIKHGMSLLTT